MPTKEDFAGVVDALLRLMDTYDIPPSKFVDGTFSPVDNSPKMSGQYIQESCMNYRILDYSRLTTTPVMSQICTITIRGCACFSLNTQTLQALECGVLFYLIWQNQIITIHI